MDQCRTCATLEDNTNTGSWRLLHEIVDFVELLKHWNVRVDLSDGLGEKICNDCYEDFVKVQMFRIRCTKAYNYLGILQIKYSNQAAAEIVQDQSVVRGHDDDGSVIYDSEQHPTNIIEFGIDELIAVEEFDTDDIIVEVTADEFEISEQAPEQDVEQEQTQYLKLEPKEEQLKEQKEEHEEENKVKDQKHKVQEHQVEPHIIENGNVSCEIDVIDDDDDYESDSKSNKIADSTEESLDEPPSPSDNVKRRTKRCNNNEEIFKIDSVEPNPLLCKLCLSDKVGDLYYRSKDRFDAHQLQIHFAPQNRVKCLLCNEYFVDLIEGKSHFKIYHHAVGENCPVCGRFYTTANSFNRHIIQHKRSDYTCDVCGLKMHNILRTTYRYHTYKHIPEKQHKCTFEGCEKTFLQGRHLRSHLKAHVNERRKTEKLGVFPCPHCEQTFHSESTLKNHQIKHTPSEDRPYPCELCYSFFKKPVHLRDHHNFVHLKLRPFVCDICGKSFQMLHYLNEHKQLHIQAFQCDQCDWKFTLRRSLKQHKQTIHKKDQKYSCDYCDQKFFYRNRAIGHMQRMHKELYYKNTTNKRELKR